MISKNHTKSERQEIAEYSKKHSFDEARRHYRIGAKKLGKYRKEFGIRTRGTRAGDYARALNAVKYGSTFAAAAKKYKVSAGTLNRMSKESEDDIKGVHPALMLIQGVMV